MRVQAGDHEDGRALARAPEVTLERVGRDAVLYDRRNGRAHVLNESAARVWELCDGGQTIDRVTSDFAASYHLEPASVHADVQHIVESFRGLGVLE